MVEKNAEIVWLSTYQKKTNGSIFSIKLFTSAPSPINKVKDSKWEEGRYGRFVIFTPNQRKTLFVKIDHTGWSIMTLISNHNLKTSIAFTTYGVFDFFFPQYSIFIQ